MRKICCTAVLFCLVGCGADDGAGGRAGNSGGVGSGATSAGGAGSGAAAGAGFGGFAGIGGVGGVGGGTGAVGGSNGNGLCGSSLTGTVRDFQASHPDFEYVIGSEKGIVEATLGPDQKPVYAGGTGQTTTGKANFDQWYNDVPGTNQTAELKLQLMDTGGGVFTYDTSAFFPIDGQLFGNEGNVHNFHFTFELHTKFRYNGGETFAFRGDDDLFVFINGKLAIDLGGVHGAQEASVALDAEAAALGMTVGQVYPLDFFFAERHTSESNFRIDTTIAFTDCGSGPPK